MIPSFVPLSLELRTVCRCTPAQVTTRSWTRRGAWVVEGTACRTHSSYPGYVAASSQCTRSLFPSYLPLLSTSPLIPPLFPLYLFVSSLPLLSFFLILIPFPPLVFLLSSRAISSSRLFLILSQLPLLSSSLVFLSYPHLGPSLLSSSCLLLSYPLVSSLILSSPSLCSHVPLFSTLPLFSVPALFLSLHFTLFIPLTTPHALTLSLNLTLCPLTYPYRSLFSLLT